jgi:hypothetical protein
MEAEVRYYPKAVFPSLWQRIEDLVTSGDLGASEEVLVEISLVDDELHDWCRARPGMFYATDASIQSDVARLQAAYPGFVPTTGRSRGDPFVVATAIATGSIVVTQEKPTTLGGRPKIPNVCDGEAVGWVNLLGMIKAEGWTF